MGKLVRILLLCLIAVVIAGMQGCSRPRCVLAPPGPVDLGPAMGLSTPPSNAFVFDLSYLARTGAADDLDYHSYWGYGGSTEAQKGSSFLQDLKGKASQLYFIENTGLKGREWSALEYAHRQAFAFYFDLNADGKFAENERILPSRKVDQGFEFITPDFMQPLKEGGQILCRTLLRVNFYGGSEPNCMWSPAALLEGKGRFERNSARLLLYASSPGGGFDQYGASSYSLLLGDQRAVTADQYIPRETLSSLIASDGQFYHLTIEGKRSNGLPARIVLVKDTTPTGMLAINLSKTNSIRTEITSLYLHGVDDKTVFLRIGSSKIGKTSLPEGAYAVSSGVIGYGIGNSREWEMSFSDGPCATIKQGHAIEVLLGQPTLKIKAIEERNRYNSQVASSTTFKRGTRIYFEPKIVGKGEEVFSRFRQSTGGRSQTVDSLPTITITGSDGKQLLSKSMEYG